MNCSQQERGKIVSGQTTMFRIYQRVSHDSMTPKVEKAGGNGHQIDRLGGDAAATQLVVNADCIYYYAFRCKVAVIDTSQFQPTTRIQHCNLSVSCLYSAEDILSQLQ